MEPVLHATPDSPEVSPEVSPVESQEFPRFVSVPSPRFCPVRHFPRFRVAYTNHLATTVSTFRSLRLFDTAVFSSNDANVPSFPAGSPARTPQIVELFASPAGEECSSFDIFSRITADLPTTEVRSDRNSVP